MAGRSDIVHEGLVREGVPSPVSDETFMMLTPGLTLVRRCQFTFQLAASNEK